MTIYEDFDRLIDNKIIHNELEKLKGHLLEEFNKQYMVITRKLQKYQQAN